MLAKKYAHCCRVFFSNSVNVREDYPIWSRQFCTTPESNVKIIGHIRILGIGLELACNGGSCAGISLKRNECNLHLKRLPRNSLTCKLVPVQYREYEYGLLWHISKVATPESSEHSENSESYPEGVNG